MTMAVATPTVSLHASVIIDVGTHQAPLGATTITVPIMISGGDLMTDMVGAVQIDDGGPLGGSSVVGPEVTAISYVGSIWEDAAGGFTHFATVPLPAQFSDPSLSLNTGGETVVAAGLLMELSVDITGFAVGVHQLALTGTLGGDTMFQNAGSPVVATITSGSIVIPTPIQVWQGNHFGAADLANPALESTVWGDNADPDYDGRVNCAEYAFGTDPNDGKDGSDGVTAEFREVDGNKHLFLIARQRKDASLQFVPDESFNLVDWEPITGVPEVVDRGGEFEEATYQCPDPVVPSQSRFFRVRVSKAD